ncbi:unnamed protein product [Ectocarpus fasciculatus]
MGNESSSANHGHPGAASHAAAQRSTAAGARPPAALSAAEERQMAAQNASPGAYKIPGQPKNQRFYVTIPRGVRPGQHFAVLVNGQQMMVRCPDGNHPGDRLIVAAPRVQPQQFVVEVPQNVQPGQQFRVTINNQEVMVTCPPGVRAGQRVTFQLPETDEARMQQGAPTQAAPNHQMFEVCVPDGVSPGESFALLAGGQKVMVTCPPNVKAGQKIRFQLPVQLNESQVAAIRVTYDKDGWMRCLGLDLKFHWVYNKAHDTASLKPGTIDIDASAYVRQITPGVSGKISLDLIPATSYAMDTTVAGTKIDYQVLNSVAQLPYQQKVDWLKSQFQAIRIPWEQGHMQLKVRRSHLLHDSVNGMEAIDKDDMLKIFRFQFIGEPALDAGGVSREWYQLLTEELFNPDHGLFLYSAINQTCMQINHNSHIANESDQRYYYLLGRVLGKSLMDGQITPVHLVQPIYKHLMGWPVTLRDLEFLDDQVYRNLEGLQDLEDVSQLYLDFTVNEDQLGSTTEVSLVPGGADLTVTKENLNMYLDSQVKYRLMTRISGQLGELLRGFYEVVPEPLLSVFDFQELELLLHGMPVIDMDDWIRNSDYTGDFNGKPNHHVVQWFWETVKGYPDENKAKLLQFVTGTCGVPSMGFAYLQGNDQNIRRFTIHGDKNLQIFPRSHTCFNRIDMPLYSKKADLQKWLTMAISAESTGFGIE